MRPFVALVLFFAILFVADSDIDEEEEKLPTRCHGKLQNITLLVQFLIYV